MYSFSSEVEITWNRLNKDIKKENFLKNYHIIMTSDHSVLSNNSFKSFLNTKSFNMFLTL